MELETQSLPAPNEHFTNKVRLNRELLDTPYIYLAECMSILTVESIAYFKAGTAKAKTPSGSTFAFRSFNNSALEPYVFSSASVGDLAWIAELNREI